jgi:hypothetical protein
LPRSGTTLVQQILASHSNVHGGGELPLSQEAFLSVAPDKGSEEESFASLGRIDRATVRRVAETYLQELEALDPSALRVVDKTPNNYQYLALLATLFPRARFIHCHRDLRDVALSCWVTNFAQISWANEPSSIAAHFREYERMMEHWRRTLPMPLIEVSYEALVAGFEKETRRLVDACGLAWEPQCLAFHRTRRPVGTASALQVREPLHAKSVGRWRHYAEALAPLFNQLGASSHAWPSESIRESVPQ